MTNKETDLPFIYAITPANGQTQNIVLPTDNDGASFHLRRIVFGSMTGGPASASLTNFQMYDRTFRSFTGQLANPTNERIIVPEMVYQPGDGLRFDHAPSNGTRTVYFQGIRRFPGPVNPTPIRKGNWLERPFQYVLPVSLSTAVNNAGNLINYNADIRNYDFELRRIFIIDAANGSQSSGKVSLTLINAYKRQMMNQPIPDWLINAGSNDLTNVFPVPAIIYPVGSYLQGVVAYTFGEGEPLPTRSFSLIFDGVQRFPCA